MDTTITGRPTLAITIVHQAFMWMCFGLLVTGVCAFFTASSQTLISLILGTPVFIGLIIAELVLVVFLSLRIQKMSYAMAVTSFIAYSVLNGLTLASIFLVYTATSISSAFFISAGLFGFMALYGYTTKRDLTTVGNLAFMGLIGVILASVVNIFLKNDALNYVLSYLAIAIFIGLTAYDTQKIKAYAAGTSNNQNLGILGALTLYLDFINLFLNILRIFGRRKS